MATSTIIGMAIVPFLLLGIINSLDKEHTFLKVLLFFNVFFGLFIMGAYVVDQTNINILSTFYKYIIGIVSTFCVYVFLYFVYISFKYLEKLGKFRGWKSKK